MEFNLHSCSSILFFPCISLLKSFVTKYCFSLLCSVFDVDNPCIPGAQLGTVPATGTNFLSLYFFFKWAKVFWYPCRQFLYHCKWFLLPILYSLCIFVGKRLTWVLESRLHSPLWKMSYFFLIYIYLFFILYSSINKRNYPQWNGDP